MMNYPDKVAIVSMIALVPLGSYTLFSLCEL